MLATTDAIVLALQKHSDKAHILHAYTRAGGRVNYMVYGLGRKHPAGLYTPLSLVQLTAAYPPAASSRPPVLKEATLLSGPQHAVPSVTRQTVALFVSEVLYHVLRHPMPDETMFDFLALSAQQLGETDEPQNFHISFLTGFAAQLGFAIPETAEGIGNLTAGTPHTREERQHRLQKLCAYYAEHVETWQNPKSLDVLTEVFDS